METVKCKKCGSTDVQVRTWVDANTGEVSSLGDMDELITDINNCYCKDCGDNTDLIIEQYADSNTNLLSQVNTWWKGRGFRDMKRITGLKESDFSSEDGSQDFVDACEKIWNSKSNDEKIEIWREYEYE